MCARFLATVSAAPRPPESASGAAESTGRHGEARLALLGAFELHCCGDPVPLQVPVPAQRVLAFLGLQNRPVLRAYVAGMLWLHSNDVRALGSLRSALWRVGRLDAGLIETSGQQLRLAPGVAVDVREAVDWARRLLDGGDDPLTERLDETLLTSDILPDWYDDWLLIERERFRQLRAHALERLCERLAEDGRFGQAMEAGLAAVKGEPLRESAHRAVIRICLAEGNRADAIRQYRLYTALLHDQLGLQPSSQIEELVRPVIAG